MASGFDSDRIDYQKILPGSRVRAAIKTENLTAIFETTV
jgi:hypothetical protein